jgi:flagellum-specific peptidoglycan hydrolase FlgJ|tara:strand:+ start:266 stop:955 length:690 start_codon:yes stop_codon:yes gene_type:complete
MTIMPKKYNWDNLLDSCWKWTKITFAVSILCVSAYWYGTFKPNKWSTATVTAQLEQFYLEKIKDLDLREPEFTYSDDMQFVRAMHKCIDYINFTTPKDKRVPWEMVIGQAALESGWGKSRFATKGNNLFGIRTFTETTPHLLLVGVTEWPGWGVRKFSSKCDSVKEYFRLLNEHRAYKKFRTKRQVMLENNKQLDSIVLIKTLDKFSTTKDYDQRVIRMIKKIRKLETK